ncbi:MAG: glutaredoxin family protein [Burkholderiaceae bacterium]|nr:glutaredoxin family protein [Burkholderiaceae bacterium]
MKCTATKLLTATALLVMACTGLHAQVFRIVGPDGRVTYSDKAPVEGAKGTSAGTAASEADSSALLPFALRQIVTRYPVTLYTGPGCGPCGTGRALLTSRGIPFSERTVSTNEDNAALQRLSGDNALPFITIGGQQIKGFSDVEWSQFLDAAGYPKTSQLPAAYRNVPAAPLVAAQKPAAPAEADARGTAAARPQAPVRPAAPARNSNDNPAGITF